MPVSYAGMQAKMPSYDCFLGFFCFVFWFFCLFVCLILLGFFLLFFMRLKLKLYVTFSSLIMFGKWSKLTYNCNHEYFSKDENSGEANMSYLGSVLVELLRDKNTQHEWLLPLEHIPVLEQTEYFSGCFFLSYWTTGIAFSSTSCMPKWLNWYKHILVQ